MQASLGSGVDPRNSSPEHEESGTESDDHTEEEEQSWISWFCSIKGNEFFCEVDEDYIHDEFNLTGLSQEVPYFDYALDAILDVDSPGADLLTEAQQETVDAAAEFLYGLIHARYILTAKGLNAMHEKYQEVHFGRCSRVYCQGQPLLPAGLSDLPRTATVVLYCPRCNDVYYPKASRHTSIDGAYFGTTFPHLFLMTFAACVPQPPLSIYVPRVFGFRVRREPLPDVAAAAAAASEGSAEAAAGAGRAAGSADLDSVIQRLGAASLVPATMAGIKPVRAIGPAGLPAEVLKDAVPRSEATHTAALGAVGDRGELFERRGENGEGEDEDEDEEDESDDADLEEATSAAAPPSESGAAAVATGAE